MENKTKRPLLDSMVDSKELQILKTIVPYLHESQQKNFAMAIRFIEFIKTTELFEKENTQFNQELQACSGESDYDRTTNMFQAVKSLCTKREQEQIDMILNILEMSMMNDTTF